MIRGPRRRDRERHTGNTYSEIEQLGAMARELNPRGPGS